MAHTPSHQTLEELVAQYRRRPGDLECGGRLAHFYLERGWDNQALDLYRELLQYHPDNYPVLLDYGNCLYRRRAYKEALRVFTTLTKLKPGRVEGWNNLGIVQLHLNFDSKARRSFENVLELEPDNPGALLNMGNVEERKGNFSRAAKWFQRAVAVRRDFPDAWFNLGNASCALHDYDTARHAYEKALSYQPEFASALKNLGLVAEQTGDDGTAIHCYESALKLDKVNAGLCANLARAHERKGAFESATHYYRRATRLSPGDPSGWRGLRRMVLCKGDIDGYVEATGSAVSWLSGDEIAESVRYLRRLGRFDDAAELVERADERNVVSDELDGERLLAYNRRKKHTDKAALLLKRLSALSVMSPALKTCLATYFLSIGEVDRAGKYLVRPDPDDYEMHRCRWDSVAAKEEYDRLVRILHSWCRRHPDCAPAWYRLCGVHLKRGEIRQARESLVRALQCGFTDMAALNHNTAMKALLSDTSDQPASVDTVAAEPKPAGTRHVTHAGESVASVRQKP